MKKNTAYRILLSPFSLIFGAVAALRRKAFQKGWFRSATFSVPTICVGNLRVGGTGKTPHVEYIAKFLSQNHQIAILSRGYGRKTKGYINAHETKNLTFETIGDEPMQYATKFPNVEVAVCEKRKIGIEKILQRNPNLEFIILDDAYQHLSVNYSLRILLTEYERPCFLDFPIPSGALREFRSAAEYADIIIVTKCPETLTEEEKEFFTQKLKLLNTQQLFFSKYNYQISNITSAKADGNKADGNEADGNTTHHTPHTTYLLITGIANPTPLVQYLKKQFGDIHCLHFPDHHSFSKKNIDKIIKLKEKLGGESCTVITTEKDAARLQGLENMPEYYTILIEIEFLEKEDVFKEKLLTLLPHNET